MLFEMNSISSGIGDGIPVPVTDSFTVLRPCGVTQDLSEAMARIRRQGRGE